MTPLSETILAKYQVRKTRQQKTAFIDFLRSRIPELQVEEGGFGKNRNLIIGDAAKAKVLLTAHYDTCARLPFPNFITPKNLAVYIGYSLLILIPFLALMAVLGMALGALSDNFLINYWGSVLPPMALLFWVLMGGKPNPHTANDNTSGVIMLCELYASLPAEVKEKVAFVFFDNEENGLLGSAFFANKHKQDNLKEKLVINYDCVSDGDHLLFVQNKPARKQYGQALEAAFPATEEKNVYLEKSSTAFYPSDQANFPVNIAVAALKKNKLVGLYMDKIHTKHDTNFDQRNIEFLRAGTARFLGTILN